MEQRMPLLVTVAAMAVAVAFAGSTEARPAILVARGIIQIGAKTPPAHPSISDLRETLGAPSLTL